MHVNRWFRRLGCYCRTIPAMFIIFSFTFGTLRAEVIEETGSLRGFLAGNCETTAYDNWISHTSEGIASPGYNDYGPVGLDPQTDGFGDYRLIPDTPAGDAIMEDWRLILEAFYRGQLNLADMRLADSSESYNYEVVLFHDIEFGHDFYLLRERLDPEYVDDGGTPDNPDDDVIGGFRNGWGVFVVNPEATRSHVVMQMVHPNDDFTGVHAAVHLFFRLDCGALAIHGSGREVVWTESGGYTNSKSLSDPSRTGRAPLQVFQEVIVDSLDSLYPLGPFFIQYHSFDCTHESPKSIVLSAGQYETYIHKPFRDRTAQYHDIIHLTPATPITANQFGYNDAVPVEEYYWLNYPVNEPFYYHYEYGDSVLIPRALNLRCDPNNKQENGLHDDEYVSGAIFENFFHVEIDEYPTVLEEAAYPWLDLFGDERPPTYETFDPYMEYYEPFHQAIEDWFEELESEDITPPQTVSNLDVTQTGPSDFNLSWDSIVDGNFVTYEIVADEGPVSPGSQVFWDFRDDPMMVDMNYEGATTVTSFPDGITWNVVIRAVDFAGNRSNLSNIIQVTPLDEDGIFLDPSIFDRYPVEAWPAWATVRIDDPADLDSMWIEWQTDTGLEGSTTLSPVFDDDVLGCPFDISEDDIAVGDTLYWRVQATDLSITGNPTVAPEIGWFEVEITDDIPYPYEYDFEQDDGDLFSTGDWEWGQPSTGPESAYSGQNVWATDLNGTYLDQSMASLLLENVELQGYGPLLLTWMQWYDYEDYDNQPGLAYDGGLVRVTYEGQSIYVDPLGDYTHRVVAGSNPVDGEDVFSGSSGGWVRRAVNLQPWQGATLDWLGFVSTSDAGSSLDGWYIDDMEIVPRINTLPPQPFSLISPENDADLDPSEENEFNWYACLDPDPFAYPEYFVSFILNSDTVSFSAGLDTSLTVRLDTTSLATQVPAYIYWWVTANSQDDLINSLNTWRFAVSPFNDTSEPNDGIPVEFALEAAYPNPFNPVLNLKIAVPSRSLVEIEIYNMLGRRVALLDRRLREPGRHTVQWNADGFTSGMYLVSMISGQFSTVRKVVMVK